MKWFIFFAVIILLSILIRFIKKSYANKKSSLSKHGFQVLDSLSESDVNYLKHLWESDNSSAIKKFLHTHPNILKQVQSILGTSYVFQDYIFLIEKSRIHTCHRDLNAQQFNPKQLHPSYTIIFYLEDMDRCLDVIPESDKSLGVYLTDETESVQCRPGNAILFNSALIHAGSMNEKEDNKRVQMKLTHKDDIEAIDYFQGYNKKLESENNNSQFFNTVQKHMSCQVPVVSDLFKSSAVKPMEKVFSSIFYGNENFYELTDIKS
jgi:ectoine hydroxylase-related dioxygenase (phytanoyl-CoA dioxygenase family)